MCIYMGQKGGHVVQLLQFSHGTECAMNIIIGLNLWF